MILDSREFKFLKNYRNIYVKSSAKREYRDLLNLGNLHQNAKRYEARSTEREARDENVRAKRAHFFYLCLKQYFLIK